MKVGLVKEVKPGEGRVALTSEGARELVQAGLVVTVQAGAGIAGGFPDSAYARAGALVVPNASDVFAQAELVVKVKEIERHEVALLRPTHTIFAYLHARMFHEVTSQAMAAGCTGLTYEEVVLPDGTRPLLQPMSRIAGKLGFVKALEYLQSIRGGSGVLAMAVEGVAPPKVLVLGAGVVGSAAAEVALALGNVCHVVEIDDARRATLKKRLPAVQVHPSTEATIRALLPEMDVVMNAATVPAHSPTHLIARSMLRLMKRSAIIVDVSCDVAGAIETCRLTTHQDPVCEVDGIRHYCVDNIPGAVPVTASRALCAATFPYVKRLAELGPAAAVRENPALARAVVFARGRATNAAFAEVLGLSAHDVLEVLR